MGRLLDAVKRANATRRPESSVLLRAAVLATVVLGVAATWLSGAAAPGDAATALLLLPVGAWLSHVRRDRDNTVIKLLLTVGAVLALARFFGDIRSVATIDDTRAPLGALFLAVQVLHGFDLPQRRDLGFTLASSLSLIALAAVNADSGRFGASLLVYAVLAAVSLAAMQRSAARERADVLKADPERRRVAFRGGDPEASPSDDRLPTRSRPGAAAALARGGSGLLRAAAPVMGVGLAVFLLLPRADTATLGTFSFSGFPSVRLPAGIIVNPGLAGNGQAAPDAGGPPLSFSSDAYFGFSNYVDLRTVGDLPDTPILRVRADRPRFWRGMVFDRYDGIGWTRTAPEPEPTFGTPVTFAMSDLLADRDPAAFGTQLDELVQTFELLDDTPNLIFGAADAREVYLSAGQASRWDDGTVSTNGIQDEGIVYTVVSVVDTTPASVLRTRGGAIPDDIVSRYTQLPDTVPDRVHELAARLTAGATTTYAKAEAVEAWIGANTVYTLDAPPPPRSGDLSDHFLFESRAGWCEPIATGMVALLRSAGVPARFATGFQPGDRNPLTRVWDVQMSDAHAWVEVWVPRNGWVAFDPTGAVPEAVDGSEPSRIPLVEVARWMGTAIAGLVPAAALAAVGDLARTVTAAPLATLGALVAMAGALVGAARRQRRRVAAAAWAAASPFARLVRLADGHGIPRDRWQTPREFVTRLRLRRADLPAAALAVLLADEERRRYADGGDGRADPAVADALTAVHAALTRDR